MNSLMNRFSIVILALSAMLTGCLTIPRNQEVTYVPGSDPAVQSAKAGMTVSNAVDLLGKYIVQYVDRTAPESSSSDPFSQALGSKGRKPTVTTNGYSYVNTEVSRWGNQVTVSMKSEGHKFADVVRIAVVNRIIGETTRPYRIVLYENNNVMFLECPMGGSEALVPRVLAAAEMLCPNVGKEIQSLPDKAKPVVAP